MIKLMNCNQKNSLFCETNWEKGAIFHSFFHFVADYTLFGVSLRVSEVVATCMYDVSVTDYVS